MCVCVCVCVHSAVGECEGKRRWCWRESDPQLQVSRTHVARLYGVPQRRHDFFLTRDLVHVLGATGDRAHKKERETEGKSTRQSVGDVRRSDGAAPSLPHSCVDEERLVARACGCAAQRSEQGEHRGSRVHVLAFNPGLMSHADDYSVWEASLCMRSDCAYERGATASAEGTSTQGTVHAGGLQLSLRPFAYSAARGLSTPPTAHSAEGVAAFTSRVGRPVLCVPVTDCLWPLVGPVAPRTCCGLTRHGVQ